MIGWLSVINILCCTWFHEFVCGDSWKAIHFFTIAKMLRSVVVLSSWDCHFALWKRTEQGGTLWISFTLCNKWAECCQHSSHCATKALVCHICIKNVIRHQGFLPGPGCISCTYDNSDWSSQFGHLFRQHNEILPFQVVNIELALFCVLWKA